MSLLGTGYVPLGLPDGRVKMPGWQLGVAWESSASGKRVTSGCSKGSQDQHSATSFGSTAQRTGRDPVAPERAVPGLVLCVLGAARRSSLGKQHQPGWEQTRPACSVTACTEGLL